MEQVLRRLSSANLKLNWAKCQMCQSRVTYLGHWLSDQGKCPDTNKLQAIQDMPYPESLTDVSRFLGMPTYLGEYIPDLSKTKDPLRQLTKKDPFLVNKELLHAFSHVKKGITSALQKLAYYQPSFSDPTAISCDASLRGLGAILWQQNERGQWIPVTCASTQNGCWASTLSTAPDCNTCETRMGVSRTLHTGVA
jgi:hypothetical protein